jgi:hypothetical protein
MGHRLDSDARPFLSRSLDAVKRNRVIGWAPAGQVL